MRIAVDAMGGDHAPYEIILGACEAARSLNVDIILVGDEKILAEEVNKHRGERISICHASQKVEMNDHPVTALRQKKDSSIMVATSLVKEGKADALVSCGNTGAQMAAAIFLLDRFEGIDRPALAASIPRYRGHTILLDVGANVDVKPRQLVQFALMGRAYAQVALGLVEPRIGLLSNGEEEGKGNQSAVKAYQELKEVMGMSFVGNIEGRDLFQDKADVVVCDGFVGNILLKALEGLASLINHRLEQRNIDLAREVIADFDYTKVGGVPLLGVKGVSVVCHGSSRSEAVVNGIRMAVSCVEGNLVRRLSQALEV